MDSQSDLERGCEHSASVKSTFIKATNKEITLSWDLTLELPALQTKANRGLFKRDKGKNVSGETPKTKTILRDIAGEAKPGQLVAIMGASGAGKTSLMNCLSQRNRLYEGYVMVNYENPGDSFRSVSGFVQQDDLFIPTLTTREHLMFIANMKMHEDSSNQERIDKVNGLLTELGLDRCADLVIGGGGSSIKGISGGERKRLNIASEVLSDPTLLFADEPTSGLDSFMAETVVRQLQHLAVDCGYTVICTIHQPSSSVFGLFTNLLLLSKGRVAYFGPGGDNVANYFNSIGFCCPKYYNVADYVIEMLAERTSSKQTREESEQRIEEILGAYERSGLAADSLYWAVQRSLRQRQEGHAATALGGTENTMDGTNGGNSNSNSGGGGGSGAMVRTGPGNGTRSSSARSRSLVGRALAKGSLRGLGSIDAKSEQKKDAGFRAASLESGQEGKHRRPLTPVGLGGGRAVGTGRTGVAGGSRTGDRSGAEESKSSGLGQGLGAISPAQARTAGVEPYPPSAFFPSGGLAMVVPSDEGENVNDNENGKVKLKVNDLQAEVGPGAIGDEVMDKETKTSRDIALLENGSGSGPTGTKSADEDSGSSEEGGGPMAIPAPGTASTAMAAPGMTPGAVPSILDTAKQYQVSQLRQFFLIYQRANTSFRRDPILFRIRLGQSVLLSTLMGLIYLRMDNDQPSAQNKMGLLFFVCVNSAMLPAFGVPQTFPLELPIFLRETKNNMYSVGAYFLGKTFAEIPFQFLFPALYGVILYFMAGLRQDFVRFLLFEVVLIGAANAGISLGYLISAMAPTVSIALGLLPIVFLPMMIFAGLMINVNDIPVYFIWFEAISMMKYAYRALSIIEWKGAVLECPTAAAASSSSGMVPPCLFPTGEDVLDYLSFSHAWATVYYDIVILVAMTVGFRFLAYVFLKAKAKNFNIH